MRGTTIREKSFEGRCQFPTSSLMLHILISEFTYRNVHENVKFNLRNLANLSSVLLDEQQKFCESSIDVCMYNNILKNDKISQCTSYDIPILIIRLWYLKF